MPSCNTYHLTWVSLTLGVGISSRLLQQSAAIAPYLGRGVSPHCRLSWSSTWDSSSRPSCTRAATAPWNTDWSRAKTNRVLPRKCTGHNKHPLPTTQEKTLYMDITRWSTPKSDRLYFCSQRWRSSIQSAKTRPGADCGSDHELLIAKFRLTLEKVGKTTRPFRYDLNQIPYDYTVEVRNIFKGLDLIDRVPDELWTEVCDIVQETGIKTIPKGGVGKKQNGCLRRPYK